MVYLDCRYPFDYEKANADYDSSVDSMKIGVVFGGRPMGTFPMEAHLKGKTSQDFLQVLPKISLRYQCSPGTFTYVSVAKGYKTGGYNVQMFGDLVQEYAKYDLMSKFMPGKMRRNLRMLNLLLLISRNIAGTTN